MALIASTFTSAQVFSSRNTSFKGNQRGLQASIYRQQKRIKFQSFTHQLAGHHSIRKINSHRLRISFNCRCPNAIALLSWPKKVSTPSGTMMPRWFALVKRSWWLLAPSLAITWISGQETTHTTKESPHPSSLMRAGWTDSRGALLDSILSPPSTQWHLWRRTQQIRQQPTSKTIFLLVSKYSLSFQFFFQVVK